MTSPAPVINGHVIVLLGDFNPIIFSPVWFAAQGLIRTEEAERADTNIVHQDVVNFTLDWLRLNVTRDRFIAETTKEPFELLRDLVLGTFTLLRHTPIRRMGINYSMHFSIPSIEKWHRIGHLLAPKEIWNHVLDNPGLTKLSVIESDRRDGLRGRVGIELEPSRRVHPGLYILVNDHYEVKDDKTSIGCDEIVDILKTRYESSVSRAHVMVTTLLEKIDERISSD